MPKLENSNVTFWVIFKQCVDLTGRRNVGTSAKKVAKRAIILFKPLSYDDDKVASVDGAQQQLRKLSTHSYLISTVIKTKLSSLMTYIFEIYRSNAFQRGITWAKSLANSWDSDSQLLEVIIKMSPDGANFLVEMFLEVKEASMQKITISALLSATIEHF